LKIAVIDKSERQDGTFSRSDFTYDPEADTYICPEGTILATSGRIVNEGTNRLYLGKHLRLWFVSAEGALLPEHASPQDHAQYL
jgi:hypothetical protein